MDPGPFVYSRSRWPGRKGRKICVLIEISKNGS